MSLTEIIMRDFDKPRLPHDPFEDQVAGPWAHEFGERPIEGDYNFDPLCRGCWLALIASVRARPYFLHLAGHILHHGSLDELHDAMRQVFVALREREEGAPAVAGAPLSLESGCR